MVEVARPDRLRRASDRRRQRSRPILPVVVALLAASPAAAQPIVALASSEVHRQLGDPAPLVGKIDAALTSALSAAGFSVIPAAEFDAAFRERTQEAGGYFDPVTGAPDLERSRAVRAAALADVHARFGAPLVVRPALTIVAAPFARGKAEWDGARATASPSGAGEVPALTLVVTVGDLTGREAATSRAGVHLLAKYSTWNSKYREIDHDDILSDVAQVDAAVTRALAPLLDVLRHPPEDVESSTEALAPRDVADIEAVAIEIPPAGTGVAALVGFLLPQDGTAVPEEVRVRYLTRVRGLLETEGWWVLPYAAYEIALLEAARDLGGLHDPLTGAPDAAKHDAAVSQARTRLAERYGASVFVTAAIFVRPARFFGETAQWDGVAEQVTDIATWKKVLTTTRGTTHALSFGVAIEDAGGATLHTGLGGIQLLDRIEKNRFVPVPPSELFVDPERERRAVELALGAWGNGE